MSDSRPKEPTVPELFDLSGRRALVTGASGYLGGAMARALAEAGATVVVGSRDLARAEAVAAELPRSGAASHRAVELDQMDEASLERGFRQAVEAAGGLDVLVNNGHEPLAADWTDVTGAEFTRQLANATGYFLLARLMRNHAVERGAAASVIMLGSMYGLVGSYPEAYEGVCPASPAAYHALKGGIVHLTRHLAVYWARDRRAGELPEPGAVSLVQGPAGDGPPAVRPEPHEAHGAGARAEGGRGVPGRRRQQLRDRPQFGGRRRLDRVVAVVEGGRRASFGRKPKACAVLRLAAGRQSAGSRARLRLAAKRGPAARSGAGWPASRRRSARRMPAAWPRGS